MTFDEAEVRKWYRDNGMTYLEADWGERSDTGESAEDQTQAPEYTADTQGVGSAVRSSDPTPANQWWWEDQRLPWAVRSPEEREYHRLLEAFFAPYIALLPRQKGNLVRQVFNDTKTYAEVAEGDGMSRQGARQATQRALRDLVHRIALDDPFFVPEEDRRRRNYEAENEAAWRVLRTYLYERDLALD